MQYCGTIELIWWRNQDVDTLTYLIMKSAEMVEFRPICFVVFSPAKKASNRFLLKITVTNCLLCYVEVGLVDKLTFLLEHSLGMEG